MGKPKCLLDLKSKNLSKMNLPDDENLFQECDGKAIYWSQMPEMDYSKFDFDGVNIRGTKFTKNSILPKRRDFFQIIKDKNVSSATLPILDLNEYDLNGVDFGATKFAEGTIFPKDKEFFRKIKAISGAKLPSGDYSTYNFNDVNMQYVHFTPESKLPACEDLLVSFKGKSIEGIEFPEMDFSKMDFYGVLMTGVKFTKNSFLPKNKNLFQKVAKLSIFGAHLPSADYSEYDFTTVLVQKAVFTEDSILPSNMFQVVYNKKITGCVLPAMDYRHMNFSGAELVGTVFPEEARLPESKSLFQSIWQRDLSKCILPKIDLNNYDLTGVRFSERTKHQNEEHCYTLPELPTDKEIFRKLRTKCLRVFNLQNADLTEYNLKGVSFSNCDLRTAKLNLHKNIFKEAYDSSLSFCKIAKTDFAGVDFTGVSIIGTEFEEGTILPLHKDFFKNLKPISLENVTLPSLDYSRCDFSGVRLLNTVFGENSILPTNPDFFQKLGLGSRLSSNVYPQSFIDQIHLMDLSGIHANLREYNLSDMQITVIKAKNRNNRFVQLPKIKNKNTGRNQQNSPRGPFAVEENQ